MNCKIYVTEFKINAKYYNTIIDYSSWEFYDPWSENYQRVSKEWKEKRVKPLLQPYNFHFEPWKEMITGFDPENYADWELFRKAARNQHHFFWNIENAEFWNEERYDWMPESMMETMMAYYIVYKMVDENGHLVNTKPYLQKYLDTYHQKKEAHLCSGPWTKNKEKNKKNIIPFFRKGYRKRNFYEIYWIIHDLSGWIWNDLKKKEVKTIEEENKKKRENSRYFDYCNIFCCCINMVSDAKCLCI